MNVTNAVVSHKKNVIRIAVVTALILLIPLIAMQFSEEVNWNLADFVVASVLLFGTGMVYEFAVKKLQSRARQMIATILLLVALLGVWAELAVGVFGSPFAGS